jgi:hypothetical protein
MTTTISVSDATRKALQGIKFREDKRSLEDVLQALLHERAELEQRRQSGAFLASIAANRDRLAELCARHQIQRLSVFGSALHGDARPDSDIDLLVEFEAGHTPSGFTFVAIQEEISGHLGFRVDLNTPQDLSPHFRAEALREAQAIHVAA